MGFFNVDQIIDAFKNGSLDEALGAYDANDLAILHKELEGYAVKHNRQDDLKGLLITVQNMVEEKSTTL